ncbi:MAG: DEAD/DEAH box helicase [Bradymonadaceae bacterium]
MKAKHLTLSPQYDCSTLHALTTAVTMIIIHALWDSEHHLHLWGEDSALPTRHAPRRGRRARVPAPRDHPFAAAIEQVIDIPGEPSSLTVLLPSSKDGPQSSPGLLWEEDAPDEPDTLAPWIVPTLRLSPVRASQWILSKTTGWDELIWGDTLRYWRAVVTLADELVRAGRVLPGLEVGDEGPIARWRPAPARSEDYARLQALRETMPPLARAVVSDEVLATAQAKGWEMAAVPAARTILTQTFEALVDSLTRTRLARSDGASLREKPKNVHDAWLRALTGADPTVDASPRAVEAFLTSLTEWTRPLQKSAERPVRLCFRLEPPEDDDEAAGPWRLAFVLQAIEDPSLLVDAAEIWRIEGATMKVLERHLDHPQEALLEELGRAMTLFPDLAGALDTARPQAMDLDAAAAFRFLTDHAALLEQAGFGVIVPAWWHEPGRRLGARIKARSSASSAPRSTSEGLGVKTLCDFEWEVVLGDTSLSRDELERLAELKMPLVRVRGQWVSLRPADLERALRLFDGADDPRPMNAGEVVRQRLGLEDAALGLPVVDWSLDGWLGDLLNGDFDEHRADCSTPAGFHGELRPYQGRGLAWLRYLEALGFGACLADDMGLGKTIQVLARLVEDAPHATGPTLVICPLSVVGNWRREARAFAPGLDVRVHHGPARDRSPEFIETLGPADLVITTYDVVRSDVEILQEVNWHRVVLDEAQMIKNTNTGRTRAVRALPARHRVALSGTPVENRLLELWSIMHFLNPGMLGTAKAFHERIALPIESGGSEDRAELLRRVTGPFIMRRLKTDRRIITDLPEKLEFKEYCHLTREQATLYKAVTDEMLTRLESSDGIARQGLVLTLMTRLKQICNHPVQFLSDGARLHERSGKLDRLADLAQEIVDAGDKALIFTQYTAMAGLIRRHLQDQLGRPVLYLHGGSSQEKRDEMVARFQSDDGPPFFLLSLRAGGTGLTLTAASHVIHYDRWWNPAVEDQATDRAFRIGQKANVQVRKLICEGTLEEKIDAIIDRKKALADRVLTSGEAGLGQLSNDEIREIVTLSQEAFA